MRHNFGAETYGYGEVERALGLAMHAGEGAQGALRARLKRLQALEIPAPKPDDEKGRRKYSLAEAHMWLIALMVEDLGLAPEFVARHVRRAWLHYLAPNAEKATAEDTEGNVALKSGVIVRGNPIILDVRLSAITGPWRTNNPDSAVKWVRLIQRYNKKTLRGLHKHWPQLKKEGWTHANLLRAADEVGHGFDGLHEEEGWLVVRNYSQKAHALENALRKKGSVG